MSIPTSEPTNIRLCDEYAKKYPYRIIAYLFGDIRPETFKNSAQFARVPFKNSNTVHWFFADINDAMKYEYLRHAQDIISFTYN